MTEAARSRRCPRNRMVWPDILYSSTVNSRPRYRSPGSATEAAVRFDLFAEAEQTADSASVSVLQQATTTQSAPFPLTFLLDGVETGVYEVVKFESLIVVPIERTERCGIQRRWAERHGARRSGSRRIVASKGAQIQRVILTDRDSRRIDPAR